MSQRCLCSALQMVRARAVNCSVIENFCRNSTNDASARPPTGQMSNLCDIGSRSIFTSEQDIFRENVRKFFREEMVPHRARWEAEGCLSRDIWQKAGTQGLLGITIPAEKGGIGGTFSDAAIVIEEQAYAERLGLNFSVHSDIALPYIAKYGTKEQIQKFIPDLVAGRQILAIAMTEPGAGSDLQGVKSYAKKDGDDYILNGSKTFISNGSMCDVVIVVAVTNREAKAAHGISLFLVEEGMPGFNKGQKLKKMGQKSQDLAELFFEDVRLPKSALLGNENEGFYYLMAELPQERLSIGTGSCAHLEWMFEETRKYVKERKAFGKALINVQTVQHKLAEMKTEICVARAFIDQCIQLHDAGKLDHGMASMTKYWLSELENKVVAQCVQLHGGMGYMWETPIARAYVDARVQTIYAGSNEIMKELIARTIVN